MGRLEIWETAPRKGRRGSCAKDEKEEGRISKKEEEAKERGDGSSLSHGHPTVNVEAQPH